MRSKLRAILHGMGSLLDFGGAGLRANMKSLLRKHENELKRRKSVGEEIGDDFRAVGGSMREAMRQMDEELGVRQADPGVEDQ
ncbi:hypothetical protein LCGC14_0318510 [marine sediment metagenome]|uniref:Uncharacterized protein n=1 Tax=marine sediment metagenome TaxID=412755 RepID=A0A0F9TQF6_9ZZZZ